MNPRNENSQTLVKGPYQHTGKRAFAFFMRASAVVICIAVLFAGICFADDTPPGGAFFKQYYIEKAQSDPEHDYSYMNTEQLDDMASGTAGTAVDTDELAIDVLGVIVSGNTAQFMLRITAKKLQSVIYDNGLGPQLPNYRFHGDWVENLNRNYGHMETGSIKYYYCDEDKSLAPNQFKILYTLTLIDRDSFEKARYRIELEDFGYFDFSEDDQFASLYDGSWQIPIAFDPASDTSRNLIYTSGITVGGYHFNLVYITVTPLACTIRLKCNPDDKYLKKHVSEIFKAFSDGTRDCSITLADGTVLSGSQLINASSGGVEGFTGILKFHAPVTVGDIVSIKLLGAEYSLKK